MGSVWVEMVLLSFFFSYRHRMAQNRIRGASRGKPQPGSHSAVLCHLGSTPAAAESALEVPKAVSSAGAAARAVCESIDLFYPCKKYALQIRLAERTSRHQGSGVARLWAS